jgi:two-component system phosphate regulon sensor histidine kinase PhoR
MAEVADILLLGLDPAERRRLSQALARGPWRVGDTADEAGALEALRPRRRHVVVLGPDPDVLARLARARPEVPLVVLGDVDAVPAALEAIRRGACDYVVARRDATHVDALVAAISRALERRRPGDDVAAVAGGVRATADGVVLLDAAGRVRYANPALARALHVDGDDLAGRHVADLMAPGRDDVDLRAALVEVGRGTSWTGALQTRGVEPPQGAWEATLTPLAEGGAVGVFRDVSAKAELEQVRADFLSMVTHDIKVPLTVILGYTEMLTDPEPPPGEIPPDILTRIRESGETIHALVCNFLDLSRIEAGRMTMDPRPVDPAELLAHAVDHYGSSARRRGLVLELAPGVAPQVVVDEHQLERVVANILGNAIKYTPSGGRITVSAGMDAGRVALRFADTGRGIPADEIPHLFEKYRRVREAKRTEGTGLGLFIAKTIVAAHGGDIRVESAVGEGSVFTVLLPPLATAAAAAVGA